MMEEINKNSIKLLEIIKTITWKRSKRNFIVNYFMSIIFVILKLSTYLTLMKLNLKRKNYTFSKYCIDNLQDS